MSECSSDQHLGGRECCKNGQRKKMGFRYHKKAGGDPPGALKKGQPFRESQVGVRWPSCYTPASTSDWMPAAS